MTSSSLRAIAVVASLSLVASIPSRALAQQPSAADLETARDLNRQGKDLRAQGRLQEALEKFRAAHDLGRTPVTGIELARTHVLLNQLVEAREVCLGIARMQVAADETERSASARAEAGKLADELRPRIPSVLVRVSGVPQGKAAIVTIDTHALPAAAIGQPSKVNPGAHEIVAKVEGGPETRVTVDVKEGETREVLMVVKAPPEAPAAVEHGGATWPPPPAPPPRSKLAIIGFSVAGVGLAVGATSGLIASSKKSNLDSLCTAQKKCGPDAYDDLDSARTWATVSTIAWALGGVGLALGVYGLFAKETPPTVAGTTSVRVTPYVGPGSVGVHGAF